MDERRARELAEQALTLGDPNQSRADTIAAAIRTAIAEEREACAKACEAPDNRIYTAADAGLVMAVKARCAAAIRARGVRDV